MTKKYFILAGILIIIMIIPPGCERGEFSWGTKIGNITYSGNAVLLGAKELALLKEVTDNRIVFSDKIGNIGNITDMSVLVMGVSEKTPYGSLRKVNTIQTNGNEVVITTSDALLSDAVKEGTIKIQEKLLEKDFKLKSKVEGVLVKGQDKSFDGLAVTLDNLEIFKDGTSIAKLNGAIGISPEIDMTIEIRFNEITEIDIVTTLNKIDEITLTSNGAFEGEKEIIAAEFIHSPIIIDSLVFIPEVAILCGYNGTISCEVSSGVRQDRVITSKMNYQLSKWSEDPLVHTESFDFFKPLVTDNSDLEIFSGPEINLSLFGVPIQAIKASGFYSLEAKKTDTPLWKLFIGNDGYNTVKADILGLKENHTLNMNIQASEISNANSK
jgi:hypothetical protein